jgi:hypothetical protein
MGGKRDLVLTVVILMSAFLVAPIVIDSIPALAGFHRGVKIVFCFAFSLCVFYALVFTWAGIVFIYRKSAKKTNSVDGE